MKIDLQKRADKYTTIGLDYFVSSLLDIVDILRVKIVQRLEEEGRYFGLAKSYMDSICSEFDKINKNVTEEDVEIFGRTLFLLKPLLIREFKRSVGKGLSAADTIILISRKILEICIASSPKHHHIQEAKVIKSILDKFHGNMRNKFKDESYFFLATTIYEAMEKEMTGRYQLDDIELLTKEEVGKPDELKEPGSRINIESSEIEIEWNTET